MKTKTERQDKHFPPEKRKDLAEISAQHYKYIKGKIEEEIAFPDKESNGYKKIKLYKNEPEHVMGRI